MAQAEDPSVASRGHYVAWVKRGKKTWLVFDDELVTEVDDANELCASAASHFPLSLLPPRVPYQLPRAADAPGRRYGGRLHTAHMCLFRKVDTPAPDHPVL